MIVFKIVLIFPSLDPIISTIRPVRPGPRSSNSPSTSFEDLNPLIALSIVDCITPWAIASFSTLKFKSRKSHLILFFHFSIWNYLAKDLLRSGSVSFPFSRIATPILRLYVHASLDLWPSFSALVCWIFCHLLCPFHLTQVKLTKFFWKVNFCNIFVDIFVSPENFVYILKLRQNVK